MNKRLIELDSLRGLAAFSVMMSHLLMVIPCIYSTIIPDHAPLWLKILKFSPLHIGWAGLESVIFFFILSGFVLSLPLYTDKASAPYGLYLIKRILRIYPPYIGSVFVAMLARELFYCGDVPNVSSWFNGSWRQSVSWSAIRDHVLLIDSFRHNDFNPVLWSLVQEMRISIIFPAIVGLLLVREKSTAAAAFFLAFFSWAMWRMKIIGLVTYNHDYYTTLQYIGLFVAGALLARYHQSLVASFSILGKRVKHILIFVAVLLYTNVFWMPYYCSLGIPLISWIFRQPIVYETITALGVSIFIVAAIASQRLSFLLKLKFVRFLGDISYSLYLFHAVCLKVLIILLWPLLPIWAILLIVIPVSLGVATLSYYMVEVPSINLGKWLTKRYRETHLAA